MIFAGVDAGGTKTAFVLCDETGRVLARHREPGGALFSVGVKGIEALVRDGIGAVCALAGIVREDIAWTGAGFPGYGEMADSERLILEACRRAVGSERVICECDCYLGWAGSLGMEAGINIVAGTGSICYGVNAAGETARSSGWGAYCDEGSCAWVGGRLVAAFAKQADGRMPRTLLYPMFREAMGIGLDMHFVHTLNHEIAASGAETAKLQLVAEKIARAGDPVATEIYAQAADELLLAIAAVARKLGLDGTPFKASYSGGLFRSGDCILAPLSLRVAQSGGTLEIPRFSPEIGAVLMAMRAYDAKVDFGGLRIVG